MPRSKKSKLRGRRNSSFLGSLQIIFERPILLYGGISILLLFLSLLHLQTANQTRITMWSMFSPFLKTVSKPFVVVGSIAGNVTSYQKLQADYKLLKEENDRLMAWYQTSQLLMAENQSLKSLLNVRSLSDHTFITARILVDPSSPYVQSVLLDAGRDDDVEVGQAVISQSGLIGRIVDVQDAISRVLLLSDINSRVPVMVEGTSQRSVMVGRNYDMPQLEYIPETVTLEKNMKIVTSGDGGVFPMGLPIGEIYSIDGDGIFVSLAAKPSTSHFVRILKTVE